jgi:parallel beta-helix repeat protein
VQNSYNNIVKDNLVNGKPLVYLERISDRTVEEAGQVILVNCSRINIQNLNISSATVAVQLLDTQQSNIIENDLSNNIYGIVLYGYLKGCSNISINKNIITSNSGYGVWLTSSSDNIVTENEVLNNSQGIVISYALNNIVSKNNIMYNAGCGIWFTSNANQNNISNNVIAHNGGDGILLRSSESNTINSNNVMDNNRGIYFEGSNGNRINSNDITLSHLQGIHFSSSLNNDICENNITNNGFQGLWLSTSSNNTNVYKNNVTMNNIGIVLTGSSNNSLYENYVTANTNYGIAVGDYASNNIVSGNIIVNNKFGVYILTSENNSVCRNSVIANSNHGIWLASSMNNLIKGNNITSNTNGVCISFSLSKQNSIYHNNFINNGKQVKIEEAGYPNYWDNDYPSGGNYWSNLFGQDTNNDGIVDVPFTIDADNIDRYPLKAPFIFCEGTWNTLAFNFDMVSNSSISSFQFNPDEGPFVHFNVTGADGTSGFCRITIPKSLLWTEDEWIITVGNQTIRDPTIITDENNTYIYFIYNHSTQTVTIQGTHVIPEFSSALILTLLMPTILIAITLLKTKRKRQPP